MDWGDDQHNAFWKTSGRSQVFKFAYLVYGMTRPWTFVRELRGWTENGLG